MRVTVNYWPKSQMCIGCPHAVFVESHGLDGKSTDEQANGFEFFGSAAYACRVDRDADGCELSPHWQGAR